MSEHKYPETFNRRPEPRRKIQMNTRSFRSGFVTLLGRPNVGKSTLLNKLVGQQISITANKPQTTRNRIRGIVTEEDWQAVILDTPGIHLPRNELHRRIVNYAVQSIHDSDLIFLLTEPLSKRQTDITPQDKLILSYLEGISQKVILLINKIDLSGREHILKTIATLSKTFPFAEIVPVSALKGAGMEVVKKFFPQYLPVGVPYFEEGVLTDTPERTIAGEFVREQVFRLCFHEVPFNAATFVEAFKERERLLKIYVVIYVTKPSHKKIIIGEKGSMLKKAGQKARIKIERLLGKKVFLSLHVKVVKNWVNRPGRLSELGYE